MLFLSALVSGIGLGSMYGLIALGFSLTWAVSRTVNFAQGTSLMLGAVICYAVAIEARLGMAIGIAAALLAAAAWGVLVERLAVRPFAARGSNGWLMATVALGIVADNAVLATFGKEPRTLPSALADMPVMLGGLGVYPLQLVIPVVGLGIAAALHLATRRTLLGKAMLATVQNPLAARLMGIDTRRVIVAAYALSAVFAAVAGMLIAPLFNVAADMGTLFGIKAFAVAIVGGIANPWGVVVAGLAYGIVEAVITAQLGSAYTQILTFACVIAALLLAPNGLFTAAVAKKV